MNRLFSLCLVSASLCLASTSIAQNATIVKFKELQRMMTAPNDTTYVFNFFATWCEPCVQEFPNFQKLSENFATQKLRVIFVSLDFTKDFKKKLLPFLKKRHVANTVILLDEPDYNSWIDRVDTNWNGNLPMTLIINNAKHTRQAFAHDFIYDSLVATIKPFLP